MDRSRAAWGSRAGETQRSSVHDTPSPRKRYVMSRPRWTVSGAISAAGRRHAACSMAPAGRYWHEPAFPGEGTNVLEKLAERSRSVDRHADVESTTAQIDHVHRTVLSIAAAGRSQENNLLRGLSMVLRRQFVVRQRVRATLVRGLKSAPE
jgi:hypothetical protein